MARTLHEIGIGADTEPFERGIREGIIDPLELSEQALEDLGAAAEDAGKVTDEATTKMEDGLVDVGDAGTTAGKDVESAGKRIEAALRETQEETKKAKDELERAGKEGSKGLSNIADAAGKSGDEITKTFENVGDALNGDLKAAGEVGQSALGAIGSALPALAPAAAVAAGAIGLITAGLLEQEKQAEKLRKKLSGMYKEAAEDGRDYLSEMQVLNELLDLRWNESRAEEWNEIQRDANLIGLDAITVARGRIGVLEDQERLERAISRVIEERDVDRLSETPGFGGAEIYQLDQLQDRYKRIFEVNNEYAKKVAANIELDKQLYKGIIDGAEEVTSKVDALGNRLYELSDGTKIMIDVDTGIASQKVDRFGKELMDVIEPGGHPRNIHLNLDLGKTQFELDEFMRKNRDLKIDVTPRLKSKGFLGPV